MNREKYYKLRNHIRSSGYSWNWGSRFKTRQTDSFKEIPKSKDIEIILSTLLHPSYDQFEDIGGIAGVWQRAKERGTMKDRTYIYWQNIIRSNVRRDNRVFSEQLTGY